MDVDELELEDDSKNSISSTSNALGFLVKVNLLISSPKVIGTISNDTTDGSLAIVLFKISSSFKFKLETL